MGKRRKGGQRVLKRDFKGPREDGWGKKRGASNDDGYQEFLLENADFEQYYKAQGIVPEDEWDDFMAALRRPLPAAFRINGSGKFAADLRDRLTQDFFSQFSARIMVEGEPLDPPQALPWYPDRLAWQLSFSRAQLRKLPALKAVHELMIRENEAGGITRQEVVSMIPPLLLDVQPSHKVLDTCAAPGSKTAQILEMLHHGMADTPTGLVVANDADAQRCNLLAHQTKRMCSPALVVVNHDATTLPLLRAPTPPGLAYKFDRVLCDVPCSGDGTMRKAPDIWKRWSAKNGNALHPLQLRIALHSATLLAVGGRMVYSTCTFNPVEDEAVVAEVLRRSEGALQLLDVKAQLPALRRMPGRLHWVVGNGSALLTSWAEAEALQGGAKLPRSMFPPDDTDALHLERCLRILPHHADSGGFFVAVLVKTAELPPGAAAVQKGWMNGKASQQAPKPAKPSGPWSAPAAEPGQDAGPSAPVAPTPPSASDKQQQEQQQREEQQQQQQQQQHKEQEQNEKQHQQQQQLQKEREQEQQQQEQQEEVGQRDEDNKDGEEDEELPEQGIEREGEEEEEADQDEPEQDEEQRGKVAHEEVTDMAYEAAGHAQGFAEAIEGEDIPTATEEAGEAATAVESVFEVLSGGEALETWEHQAALHREGLGESGSTTTPYPEQAAHHQEPGTPARKPEQGEGARNMPAAEPAVTSKPEAPGGALAPDKNAGGSHPSAIADQDGSAAQREWGPGAGGTRGGKWRGIDPVVPYTDAEQIASIREFYGLDRERLPLEAQLITRSQLGVAAPKRLYFLNAGVRELLLLDDNEQLKITALGLKMFERQDSKDSRSSCLYRIAQEGLPLLLPAVTKQRLALSAADMLRLLTEGSVALPESHKLPMQSTHELNGSKVHGEGAAPQEAASEPPAKRAKTERSPRMALSDEDALKQLEAVVGGCCICTLRPQEATALGMRAAEAGEVTEDGLAAAAPLAIACWRGRGSLTLLVAKAEAAQLADGLRRAMAKHSAGGADGAQADAAAMETG